MSSIESGTRGSGERMYAPEKHYVISQLDAKKVLGLSLEDLRAWKAEVLRSGSTEARPHHLGAKIYMEPDPTKKGDVRVFVSGYAPDGGDIAKIALATQAGFLKEIEAGESEEEIEEA